ncbi:sugar ABC transporter permease [Paenibacillus psychroresistens]|uniref:Sugar ABC transporter permease n=1 Tax=Paenibacillus psychroresistens TaxID=1778678 RepID=A0A6B8RGX9_9BACL|nr:sugar ABC transporter permease [Paenibacillus psychroresistens]QGQ94792.1 sugar ABC transporter permease [Paenibacillus psychroresistens]
MNLSYSTQKKLVLFTFILIPLTLLLTFTYYPAMNLLYLSTTSWNGMDPVKTFVGLDNYKELFSNYELLKIFSHNSAYLLAGVIQVTLALYLAVILNTRLRCRNIYKVIIFLPVIMNGVAIAFMFAFLYNPEFGALNTLISKIGLEQYRVNWLGNPDLVNFSLAFINIWRSTGFTMVIFIGALQSIPKDIYEAAQIDGASFFQSFRHITLPSILIIIELNMFLTVTGAIEAFDLPFVLTRGGPLGHSETFVTKTMKVAFEFENFGLASAMGIVLLVIVATFVFLQRRLILGRRE